MTLASAALVLALIVFWAGSAMAGTVALFRPSSNSPGLKEASYRLQGELLAVGLEVELVDRSARSGQSEEESRRAIERLASDRDLDAIFDVTGEQSPTGVEIWMFQRSPRRFEMTRVELEPSARRPSETLAIRSIEVLRSSFLELDLAEKARPDEPEPALPAEPPAPVERSPQSDDPASTSQDQSTPASQSLGRLGLEAGAAVVSGVNGVGPALLPLARFDWVVTPWLVAQATIAGLGTRPTIETERGTAEVAQHFGLLGLCYCVASAQGVRPALALSAGALRTSLDGRAELPARGHHVVRWSLLMDASLGARFPLSERYYATLASHVQLAEPYVAIHFADTTVATTGRPNLLFSLTLGAWL